MATQAEQSEGAPGSNTLDLLVKARAMIEPQGNWAQGQRAKFFGLPTCAGLALVQVSDHLPSVLFREAKQALEFAARSELISDFNDTHTHAEVLAAFDRAIATERAKATGATP